MPTIIDPLLCDRIDDSDPDPVVDQLLGYSKFIGYTGDRVILLLSHFSLLKKFPHYFNYTNDLQKSQRFLLHFSKDVLGS